LIIPCKSCQTTFKFDSSLLKPTGTKVRCSKCQEVFRVYPSDESDRRKYQRVKTRNLISYTSIDKTGKLISQGLGKALDISKGGILLETPYRVQSGILKLMATDVENNLVEIKGKLIYCTESPNGRYRSGISFIGTDEQVSKFAIKMIKEYNYRRSNLFVAPHQ
jgi:predicted Zn finger-like uncharacterized protein